MAQYLNAFSGRQFLDANGAPYSGAQLFVYIAGSSTKATVTKDSAGASNHTNPIILNTRGEPADAGGASQAIWQAGGQSVKLVLAPSTDTDPPVSAISTWDNLAGINDTSVTTDQWIIGPTPIYVSAISFTLIGDQTSVFHVGRRIKTTNSGGTIYSTITNSAYGALTTVTVVNDSGSLDAGLTAVSYGILSSTNTAIPGVKLSGSDYTHQGTVTMFGKSLWTAEGASVASAADCNIWTTDGNTVHVTGTTQIDDWGTAPQAGAWKRVIFDGVLILNYNATTNDIPGDADVTTAANDSCIVYARSASSYQIFDYTRADGSSVSTVGALTSGTVIATTSGTTADFTGIPSWVKRVTISLSGVSTNGTGEIGFRIGDSGGIESTGYVGGDGVAAFSTSFSLIATNTASTLWGGIATLTLIDSSTNTWCYSGSFGRDTSAASTGGGAKSLSGVLDRVQLFTANTFDAGKVNILYE